MDKRVIDTLSAAGLACVGLMAFPKKVRKEIVERAGGVSELSGRSDRPMEAGHLYHGVQEVDNGLLVTDQEHLAWHELFMGRAGEIGLTEDQNNWACRSVLQRCEDFDIPRGIHTNYPAVLDAIKKMWKAFMGE